MKLAVAFVLLLGACGPSDDYQGKPLGTSTYVAPPPQPAPAPAGPETPPGYAPGKWIMARGFEFKGTGASYTLMSVKNEQQQVWIGATVPTGATAQACATAAAEAAGKVGLRVSQRGTEIWFDGSNRASILSMRGCEFAPRR